MTKTFKNTTAAVEVIMDGMAIAAHIACGTCVRPTTCGKYAVIETKGDELRGLASTILEARRLNYSIHGDDLGV